MWAFVRRSIRRLLMRIIPVDDPWERIDIKVQATAFGSGSRRDFGWYFEGESTVKVESFDDIHRWLRDCRYARDREVFVEGDFWQHPCTFERLRQGDCEDFALWAWRKLLELGYEAFFVVGRHGTDPMTDLPLARFIAHAWIVFRRNGATYVYEPTMRDREQAVQLLDMVRHHYVPELGVGRERRPFAYAGYLLARQEEDRESAVAR